MKLNVKTKIIGQKVIYFEELESTQKYAKQNMEKIENGTVIITDYQTNGIGTHDRKWISCAGKNLTFSILLYPNCQIQKLENLTKEIAEILVDVLKENYDINAAIKQPNDLLINKKKFCGILTETKLKGLNVENLIIGIGMNINQDIFHEDIKEIATSLKKEYKKSFNSIEILEKFLEKFENAYLSLLQE